MLILPLPPRLTQNEQFIPKPIEWLTKVHLETASVSADWTVKISWMWLIVTFTEISSTIICGTRNLDKI